MLIRLYRQKLVQDLPRWHQNGWVSAEGLRAIEVEMDDRVSKSHLLPLVVIGVGGIALALAVVAFIAANWGLIPRPTKLIGVLALVLAGVGGMFFCERRGWGLLADLMGLVTALVFFSGLALVGQIYNLPQDWQGGLGLSLLGALAIAVLGRSRAAMLAALVILLWLLVDAMPMGWVLWAALATLPISLWQIIVRPNLLGRWLFIVTGLAFFVRGLTELKGANEGFFLLESFGFIGVVLLVGGNLLQVLGVRVRHMSWGVIGFGQTAQSAGLILLGFLTYVRMVAPGEAFLDTPSYLRAGIAGYLAEYWGALISTPMMTVAFVAAVGVVLVAIVDWLGQRRVSGFHLAISCISLAGVWLAAVPNAEILTAVAALGVALLILLVGVHEERTGWLLLGIAALSGNSLWLLYETIGSLLGQSLFFLVCGVVLIAVGLITARALRRKKARLAAAREVRP